jgi:hypothetical protein
VSGTEPSVPVGTEPSIPVGTEPSFPVGTEPSIPVGTEPSIPVGTEPSIPVGTEPVVLVGTDACVRTTLATAAGERVPAAEAGTAGGSELPCALVARRWSGCAVGACHEVTATELV